MALALFSHHAVRVMSPRHRRPRLSIVCRRLSIASGYSSMKSLPGSSNCIRQCGLNGVQLHGDEPASYCEQLRTRHPYLMIYKAMRVGEEGVKGEVSAYDEVVSALLFDTFTAAKEGGTGIAFDWGLIDSLPVSLPLILAGGLGPDNIAAAIDAVRPYAVDINSGVESEPGCKDHTLLFRLMRIVSEKNRDIETR
jgi:phosphoribosylanthranilate isomerase